MPGRTGHDTRDRSPGRKLLLVILTGLLLAVPLFATYLLVYDREAQSRTARDSIVQGWGGPQTLAGPILALPFDQQVTEQVVEAGHQVVRTSMVRRELLLSPRRATWRARVQPERRRRSIYEAVVYRADVQSSAVFLLPTDLSRLGVASDRLLYDRAEFRFGLADPRGLVGAPPLVTLGRQRLALQPGHGPAATGGDGFYAVADARGLSSGPLVVDFAYAIRGNASLSVAPRAGDTRIAIDSSWPNPSFVGGFLPVERQVGDAGFAASWRIGNLALGQPLAEIGGAATAAPVPGGIEDDHLVRVDLVSPVDLYSQVNRSVKYGFLFIGFTFAAFLLFDVVAGVSVAAAEYLLVGAGLVLFFSLMLGLAEVIGFAVAYAVAAAAIIGLLAAYSAAVLGSWRRGGAIAALLAALYTILYILLGLEAYSLLIGSLLLFAALGGVMYLTRRLDWSGTPSR